MLYNITKTSSKTGATVVETSDKDLIHEQAIRRLAFHEKMWVKYGCEVKEKSANRLVVYDKEGDETVTLTIEQQP